jgi:hypothetical protein
VFLFGGAVDFIGEDLIDKRIFGEPRSEFDDVPNKTTTDSSGEKTSKPGDPTVAPSRTGIPLDFLAGFKYSWFTIGTGITAGLSFDGPSQMKYNFLQVPLLLRGDWGSADGMFGFSLFAGAGFNVPLQATVALADEEWGSKTPYNAILSMSPSLIFGAGVTLYAPFGIYTGFRGIVDLGEIDVELSGNRTGSFKRPFQPEVTFGFRYLVPFYKGK